MSSPYLPARNARAFSMASCPTCRALVLLPTACPQCGDFVITFDDGRSMLWCVWRESLQTCIPLPVQIAKLVLSIYLLEERVFADAGLLHGNHCTNIFTRCHEPEYSLLFAIGVYQNVTPAATAFGNVARIARAV